MSSIPNRKPVSLAWQRFAEEVVARAGILDDAVANSVFAAFASVPRDLFIDPKYAADAVRDTPIAVGYGQYTPAPSLIARMLGLIGLRRGLKVLEIGCGCGYTAALMSGAGARVFAVESQGFLAQQTRKRLDKINFQNVIIHRADGDYGWTEHAPYDCILVSKATAEIPIELFSQLKNPGGRLLAPIGDPRRQTLTLWELGAELKRYALEPCNIDGV